MLHAMVSHRSLFLVPVTSDDTLAMLSHFCRPSFTFGWMPTRLDGASSCGLAHWAWSDGEANAVEQRLAQPPPPSPSVLVDLHTVF